MAGIPAELDCKVSGSEPLTVSWTKDGQDLRPGPGLEVSLSENTARLRFCYVSPAEAGQYVCKASNAAGTCETAAKMTVTGTKVTTWYF